MIDRIIHFSIYNKLIVGLFVAGLISWGIYSIEHLSIGAVPDITDNQVQIITNAPTLAAQEVEQLITYPLELSMGNIPDVEEIRSVSRFGLSVITVVFKEEVAIYLARQLIGERIKAAEEEIPTGLGKPEMGPISTGLGEIYQYVLYPAKGYEDQYTDMDLRSMQDWIVKRQLVGIPGVIEINSLGGHLKQYEIAVDPDKLKSMNLSLPELFEAVAQNNANTGGSYIEKKHYTYFIRGEGRLEDIKDIEQVVIKNVNGLPILLKDVAKVQIGAAPRFGAVTLNGRGEVVAGQVMMLKGANAAEVTRLVKQRIQQITQSLPEGIIIEPYLDRTKLVNRTTKTVLTNLLEGGLIVIFILVLLLGNFRAGLIVASVIPLSMLFAVSMMRIFGISANLMSLGAIDFGLIVDGAVIIVEAILHHLGISRTKERLTAQEMDQQVYTAATRIRTSAAFGEIIILIVYLPILFLAGVEGKMFKPMAQTVSFAIIGALVLSLTYVPMMSALFLNKTAPNSQNIANRIIGFLQRIYQPTLKWALHFKRIFLFFTIGLFAFSLWIFSRMGGEFIPTLEEGDFALHQILPPGSSLAQGVEVSAELQNILLEKFPEVEKVVTKIGTAEIPTDIMPLEAGDIFVILKPKSEWTSGKTKEELFAKMEIELNKFPGVIYEFTQPIQMRFNELMTGIRQDIAIKIYGEDLGLLVKYAKQAKSLIETIPGAGDIQVEPTSGLQQMVADYDWGKMAKHGVSAAAINNVIRTSFAGEKAGQVFEGEKRFDLVIRLDHNFRQSIDDIRNLYVPLPNGRQIPIYEVADVRFEEGPTQISRDNTQRRITIGVNARGRDVESLVKAIQQKLDTELPLPPAYYTTYGGQFENLQNARARLLVAVPAALALIFILLFLTFHSIRQTLLIYTAIPMSAIGGIWALYLRGMPFSISAGVGFIALFGVAVLNGIVLIAHFNRLKKEGVKDIYERIFQGTTVRLRPVVMTAAVASLGFLPMAISNSAGAEVQQPLATVVIGGLITATFLTLFILPILYYFSERGIKRVSKIVGVLLLFLVPGVSSFAQNTNLSLEEAIQKAKTNYPEMQAARLQVDQAAKLTNLKAEHPFANINFQGEEFDLSENAGIHSFGIQQNFNLPKVTKAKRQFFDQQFQLRSSQLALNEWQLEEAVSLAYYELLYQRQRRNEVQALKELYQQMEQISKDLLNAGETGKLPLLAAQSKQKEVQLFSQQLQEDYQLALMNFNAWLASDTLFEATQQELPAIGTTTTPVSINNHARIKVLEQQVALSNTQVEVQKSRLLPRISTGVRLQSVGGEIPFFAYQVGLAIPLFKGAQKQRIEAAKVDIQIQEKRKAATLYRLGQEQRQINIRLSKYLKSVNFYQNEILPQAVERRTLNLEAWRQGEATYLEYAQSIEQFIKYRMDYIQSLRDYHIAKVQTKYLMSIN